MEIGRVEGEGIEGWIRGGRRVGWAGEEKDGKGKERDCDGFSRP